MMHHHEKTAYVTLLFKLHKKRCDHGKEDSVYIRAHTQSCADQTGTWKVVQSEQILTCRICGLDWWIYTQLCFNAPPCIFGDVVNTFAESQPTLA